MSVTLMLMNLAPRATAAARPTTVTTKHHDPAGKTSYEAASADQQSQTTMTTNLVATLATQLTTTVMGRDCQALVNTDSHTNYHNYTLQGHYSRLYLTNIYKTELHDHLYSSVMTFFCLCFTWYIMSCYTGFHTVTNRTIDVFSRGLSFHTTWCGRVIFFCVLVWPQRIMVTLDLRKPPINFPMATG